MENTITTVPSIDAASADGLDLTFSQIRAVVRPDEEFYTEPPTPRPSKAAMFQLIDGWTTQFMIDGQPTGGTSRFCDDPRLRWCLNVIDGARGKRVLELGPLEGAHTKTLIDAGARDVIAIEGFRPNLLRCLIVKEVFQLARARYLYGDFCRFVTDYSGPPFDFVVAAGVLYHQTNPAELIDNLAKITDRVLVWSQVADDVHPVASHEVQVTVGSRAYRGRVNDYQDARNRFKNYCGGIHAAAVWLYPDELRRAFIDAGFIVRIEHPVPATIHGPSLLFVASKSVMKKKTRWTKWRRA